MAVKLVKTQISGKVLIVMAAVFCLAIAMQTWWTITQDRQVTLESEYENGQITVRLLEENARQTLRDAEGNLDTVLNTIRVTETEQNLNDDTIRSILTKAQPFNRVLKALQYVNRDGQAFVSTIDYPAYQVDADDRTYIPYLLAHPEVKQSVIGTPFQRFYDTEVVVPIARNLYSTTGKHLGIISTDIDLSYFSKVYQRVAKDNHALVAMLNQDGTIIVRFPVEQGAPGRKINKAGFIQQLPQLSDEGKFVDDRFLDESHSIPRLYTYRKIQAYPLVAVFSRNLDDILKNWRKRSADRIVIAAATILLLCILTILLWQHIHRLNLSESSLRNSQASLQASESKFVTLFQLSPVPLALIRLSDDKLLEVNQALLDQSGYQAEELLGKAIPELNFWAEPHLRQHYLQTLQQQGYVDRYEMRFRYKSGKVAVCLISSRLFSSNGDQFLIFTPIDITQIREFETQIRTLNTELEERVRQRTLSLEETNHELATALSNLTTMQSELIRSEKLAALGALVAGVAHELNTPIGNSVTVASTIFEHAAELNQELHQEKARRSVILQISGEIRRGSEILLTNLERAAQLIFSFKQVAVDQSSNHRRLFNLSTTINEILTTLEPMYRRTQHQILLELDNRIELDSYPGALAQIFTNLVNNALIHAFEHMPEGTIRITSRQLDMQFIEIQFIDNGCGIPEANLSKIFDPFFTTKLGSGGSGLGMHILYNLVNEVLGGKVVVKSKVGEGTSITMTLPRQAPQKTT